jgi:hypothetical protein
MPETGLNFREYAKLAKQEVNRPETADSVGQTVLELERDFALKHANSPETQKHIYQIELQKQRIVSQVRKDLTELRKSERWTKTFPNAQPVKFDELRGGLALASNTSQSLTEGELLTDGEWGVSYNLDASVPRELRRKYIVENARKEFRELLDDQIAADKGGRTLGDAGIQKAYLARESEPDETRAGLVAEKMVRNMLKKISIDIGADFTVKEVSLEKDVEQKIDFIIHRKASSRGVGVTSNKGIKDIGIQFTLDASMEKAAYKSKQIQKSKARLGKNVLVSDIILVQIPLRNVFEVLKEWKKQKKPGGPDKLWDRATREKIIRGVLDRIVPPQEIENICKQLGLV